MNKNVYRCELCPWLCGADREGNRGVCQAPHELQIAKYQLHYDEEPFLSGREHEGSGAIFFSYCNLHCVFCQNHLISHKGKGKTYSISEVFKAISEHTTG